MPSFDKWGIFIRCFLHGGFIFTNNFKKKPCLRALLRYNSLFNSILNELNYPCIIFWICLPLTKYTIVTHLERCSILSFTLASLTWILIVFLFKKNLIKLWYILVVSFSPWINLIGWIFAYFLKLVITTTNSSST